MPSTRHPPTQTGYPDGGPGRRRAPDGSGGVAPKYRFRTHAELDRLLTSPEDPPPAWASSLSKVELDDPFGLQPLEGLVECRHRLIDVAVVVDGGHHPAEV